MANTIGVEVVEWIFNHYRGVLLGPGRHQPAIINADHHTRQRLEQEIDAILTRRTALPCAHPRLYITHMRGRAGNITCPDCQKLLEIDDQGHIISG